MAKAIVGAACMACAVFVACAVCVICAECVACAVCVVCSVCVCVACAVCPACAECAACAVCVAFTVCVTCTECTRSSRRGMQLSGAQHEHQLRIAVVLAGPRALQAPLRCAAKGIGGRAHVAVRSMRCWQVCRRCAQLASCITC